jgi:hypothetical protein
MTDSLAIYPVATPTDQVIWKKQLENAFQTNSGITYFGLSTLLTFNYITETNVPLAVNDW